MSRSRAPSRVEQLLPLAGQGAHLGVGGAVGGEQLAVLGAGEPVEDLGLRRGQHQLPVLVLAVEGEQARAEGAQVRGRGRAPGDEGGGSAGPGRDPPREDDLLARRQPLGDVAQRRVGEDRLRDLEGALDPRLLGAGPDGGAARTAAHQQVERVGEHGLAGAGLAGDHVQSRPEAHLGALDQQEVLDPQLAKHRRWDSNRRRRIGPLQGLLDLTRLRARESRKRPATRP